MNADCRKLDLERLVGGELDREQAETVRHHCASCSDCSSYIAQLQAEKADFLQKHPFSSFTRAHAAVIRLPWYRNIFSGTLRPALVTAGAVLLVTLAVIPLVNTNTRKNDDRIRFKGAPSLSFIYRRNGTTAPGTLSGRYRGGDRIQITCPATRYRFTCLLSVDMQGTVSFYHPESEAAWCSVPSQPGVSFVFPGSIVLDDTPGAELVVALFSMDPLPTSAVTGWIERQVAAMPNLDTLNTLLLREKNTFGAEAATLLLRKE
jgi:hypothetical protein